MLPKLSGIVLGCRGAWLLYKMSGFVTLRGHITATGLDVKRGNERIRGGKP